MRSAVIAGGMASRFGGKPKGFERVGGDRILDRVVQALRAASGEPPLLIANAPDAATWRPDLRVMRDVIDELPAPVYAVSPELAEQVTGYHVHRGALASMQRKPLPTAAELLQTIRRVVVKESAERAPGQRVAIFEDIVDHANLGAAFRNAAALGVDAVFLTLAIAIWRSYSHALARRTFAYSIFFLAMLFAALMVDHYLPLLAG